MQIFHFSPATFELLGIGKADADPLDATNWLIPAHATSIAPPAPIAGKSRHFMDGAWHYLDIVPVIGDSVPTPTSTSFALCTTAVQAELDARARARGYDGILSACSYAAQPPGAPFQAEGAAFIAWRSATWSEAYAVQADVLAGLRPMPTPAEAVAAIPDLEL